MGVMFDTPADEMKRRHARLQEEMGKAGLKALLVIGPQNSNGNAQLYRAGSFRYLTDFFTMTLNAVLIVPVDAPCVAFVPTELAEDRGRRVAWIKDMRHSVEYGEDIEKHLRDIGVEEGPVGIVGFDLLPASLYLDLTKRLPDIDFVEATPLLIGIRHKKEPLEQKLTARSAEINYEALRSLAAELRPGMTEFEVVNIVETRQKGLGADGVFNLISSGDFAGGTATRPRLFLPSGRKIEKGDCVTIEISCSYGGYWTQIVRALSVGTVDDDLKRLQEATVNTLDAGNARLVTGMPIMDYFRVLGEEAERNGYRLITPTGHLCGQDLLEARVDSHTDIPLEPGMVMISHPHLVDETGRWLLWGHTFQISEKGPEPLSPGNERGVFIV